MMNLEKAEVPSSMDLANLTAADKWILCKFNDVAKDVTDNMEKFELGIAVQKYMTLSGKNSVTGTSRW